MIANLNAARMRVFLLFVVTLCKVVHAQYRYVAGGYSGQCGTGDPMYDFKNYFTGSA